MILPGNNNNISNNNHTIRIPNILLPLLMLSVLSRLKAKSNSKLRKVYQIQDVLIVIVQSTSTLKKMDNLLIVVSTASKNT